MPPGQAYLIDADVVRCRLHLVLKDGGQLRRGDVALLRRHRRGMEGALRAHKQAQCENCPRHELSLFQPFCVRAVAPHPKLPQRFCKAGGRKPELFPVLVPLKTLANSGPAPEPSPAPPGASAGPPAPRARSPAEWTDFGAVARPNGWSAGGPASPDAGVAAGERTWAATLRTARVAARIIIPTAEAALPSGASDRPPSSRPPIKSCTCHVAGRSRADDGEGLGVVLQWWPEC